MSGGQKKHKAKILWIIIFCLLVFGLIGQFLPAKGTDKVSTHIDKESGTTEKKQASSDSPKDNQTDTDTPPFSVTMLDVGQGLSLLIQSDGHYMLYDGGGRNASSYVVSYLKKNQISSLDYIVASHYDEDHISGLVGVLNTASVGKALIPDYTVDTQIYKSLINKIDSTGTPYEYPAAGQTYSLGKAQFQIIGPDQYNNEDDNDNSIVIHMQYDAVTCLFTGDASETAERKMLTAKLSVASDLYVLGHHGSATSTSDAFLDAVSPKYAFISVGKDNKYGHPTERVLNALKTRNIEVFRTDAQGDVTASSDGKTWQFDHDASTDWSPGETAENETTPPAPVTKSSKEMTYVLNTHTMKFHYPDCHSVSMMKGENKETVTSTPEELEQQGYSPCGNCKP